MNNATTFEEIEKHINSADLTAYEAGGPKHFVIADVAAAPGDVLKKICGIYHVVKPILGAVLLIPLIPEVIKKPVRIFMSLMDQLCP